MMIRDPDGFRFLILDPLNVIKAFVNDFVVAPSFDIKSDAVSAKLLPICQVLEE